MYLENSRKDTFFVCIGAREATKNHYPFNIRSQISFSALL